MNLLDLPAGGSTLDFSVPTRSRRPPAPCSSRAARAPESSPAAIRILLALVLSASAVGGSDLGETLDIHPVTPFAGSLFFVSGGYKTSCATGSDVVIEGDVVKLFAFEGCECPPGPPVFVDFSHESGPLPAGTYDVQLLLARRTETGEPCPGGGRDARLTSRVLTVSDELQIDGVDFDSPAPRADEPLRLGVFRQCRFTPPTRLELQGIGSGVVRIATVAADPATFCQQANPFMIEVFDLGILPAGAYSVVIEGLVPDEVVWTEPFTIAPIGRPTVALNRGRFDVSATWQTAAGTGAASGQPLSSDSASFWFFRPTNVELLVKVLDACRSSGHFWVFAAGLTNQGVRLTVVDTVTGSLRTYDSALGSDFAPILDTAAFPCDRPTG